MYKCEDCDHLFTECVKCPKCGCLDLIYVVIF